VGLWYSHANMSLSLDYTTIQQVYGLSPLWLSASRLASYPFLIFSGLQWLLPEPVGLLMTYPLVVRPLAPPQAWV